MDAYEATLQRIYRKQLFGIKLGLTNIRSLLDLIGRPQDRFSVLHVAGTNGKGSTAAFLHGILEAHGHATGLYTSPHLTDFRERIVCGQRRISADEVVASSVELDDAIRRAGRKSRLIEKVTFFEYVTAMAFHHFARSEVEFAVVEVGLGGRLDATNVVDPAVVIITPIAHDHSHYLGESLEEIVAEKAGIIKTNRPVVLASNPRTVTEYVEAVCEQRGNILLKEGRDYRYRVTCSTAGPSTHFGYQSGRLELENVPLRLLGRHQGTNAAAAVTAALQLEPSGLRVDPEVVRRGIQEVRWPGRLEFLDRRPHLVLDGAHNPHAVQVLIRSLKELVRYRRLLCVFGVMDDKDVEGMLDRLVPHVDRFFLAAPQINRACKTDRIAGYLAHLRRPHQAETSVSSAVRAALEAAHPEDLVLVTGSLFTVGEARASYVQAHDDGCLSS